MSDRQKSAKVYLVDPGTATPTGEFSFEMQVRAPGARTVRFELLDRDAELLHQNLGRFLQARSSPADPQA